MCLGIFIIKRQIKSAIVAAVCPPARAPSEIMTAWGPCVCVRKYHGVKRVNDTADDQSSYSMFLFKLHYMRGMFATFYTNKKL